MTLRKLAVVVSFVALAVSIPAQAATLYVANSGNDANSGSLSAPLRTINRAAALAKAGDQVQVRGGVYFENVNIQSKGTSTARIVFRSYAGETAIVDGANSPAETNAVVLNKADYVDFTGFEVRNAKRIGICGWGATNIRVTNNTIYNSLRNGIYIGGDAGLASTSNITIDGNTVRNNVLENQYHTWTGGWANGIMIAEGDRATITNNRIYNNDGEGIAFAVSSNGLIENNEVFDNFSVGIYLDNARSTTVNRNLVYSTDNSRYFRDGYPASGIGTANEQYDVVSPLTGLTVTNNIVVNTKWGFYYGSYGLGGGLKNTTVANNTFYKAAFTLLWIDSDTHQGSIVENNIFYQVGGRGMADVAGAGVIYRQNNFYGAAAGAAAGAGDVIGDPRFVKAGGTAAADYQLTGGSPAVQTGLALTTVATLATDYWGHPRTIGFDLGAHEYSLFTNSSEAGTDATAPSAPTSLAAAVRASGIELSWAAATDNVAVTGYNVYRDGAKVASVSSANWKDTAVTPATTYTYTVAAVDAAGNESGRSNGATAKSNAGPDTTAPSKPGTANVTSTTSSTIALQWGESTDNVRVTGYRVYRNGTQVAEGTALSFTDRGLQASTTYVYEIKAFDAHGNVSVTGSVVTGTTAAASGKRRAS
jgi:parallel beta-helix repeat protein